MEGSVEVTEQPEEIKKAEEILKSCYFQQDMYTEGEVRLCYDRTLLDGDTRVYLTSSPCGTGMQLSDIEHSEMTLKRMRITWYLLRQRKAASGFQESLPA